MKKRLLDTPVKIIQILPVDNESTSQQLKQPELSPWVKRTLQALKELPAAVRLHGDRMRLHLETRYAQLAHATTQWLQQARTATFSHRDITAAPMEKLEKSESPRLLTEHTASSALLSPLGLDPAGEHPHGPEMNSAERGQKHRCLPDRSRHWERGKAMMSGQWSHATEWSEAAWGSALAKVQLWKDATWQALLAIRLRLFERVAAARHWLSTRGRSIRNRSRRKSATKELEMTKTLLLAQQQALFMQQQELEQMAGLMTDVKKDLTLQKHALSDLTKIVELLQQSPADIESAPPHKTAGNLAANHPRRTLTKKSGGTDSPRPREHRA